jgi:hypothetical protein
LGAKVKVINKIKVMKKLIIPALAIVAATTFIIVFAANKKSCPKGFSTRINTANGHISCHGPSGEWFGLN